MAHRNQSARRIALGLFLATSIGGSAIGQEQMRLSDRSKPTVEKATEPTPSRLEKLNPIRMLPRLFARAPEKQSHPMTQVSSAGRSFSLNLNDNAPRKLVHSRKPVERTGQRPAAQNVKPATARQSPARSPVAGGIRPAAADSPAAGVQLAAAQLTTTNHSQRSVTPAGGGFDPLAELQMQMIRQSNELASLRSQLGRRERVRRERQPTTWFSTFENVLVQPVQGNTTALIAERDNDNDNTVDEFVHIMFPWELKYSYRFQLGSHKTDDTLGFRARYWSFDDETWLRANSQNGLIPTFQEASVPYLSEDGDITTGLAFINEGTFTSFIRADVADFELQRHVAESLDIYGGVRYAKLGQSYRADTDQGTVNADTRFEGFGPTVALQAIHALPLEKLKLYATIRGSLLYGHQTYSVSDSVNTIKQTLNAVDLRRSDDGARQFSGNAEVQFGVEYSPLPLLSLHGALEAQHFAGVGGPNPPASFMGPDAGISTDSPLDDSLSFLGISAGATFIW